MSNLRLLSTLQAKYGALSLRDKAVLMVALFAVFVFIWVQFVLFPMTDKQDRLGLTNKSKEADLLTLKGIAKQYKKFQGNKVAQRGINPGESFNLFSVLERLATESELMDKIDYMRPGNLQLDDRREERWVEIKLSQITLKDVTNYLYNLRSFNKSIYIKRLSTRKEGEYLNLILQPAVIRMRR